MTSPSREAQSAVLPAGDYLGLRFLVYGSGFRVLGRSGFTDLGLWEQPQQ